MDKLKRIYIADDSVVTRMFLSKIIKEIPNGEIWIESEGGKGSTFFIKIPLCTD